VQKENNALRHSTKKVSAISLCSLFPYCLYVLDNQGFLSTSAACYTFYVVETRDTIFGWEYEYGFQGRSNNFQTRLYLDLFFV